MNLQEVAFYVFETILMIVVCQAVFFGGVRKDMSEAYPENE